MYFAGVFSNPENAHNCSAAEALADLHEIGKVVESKVGIRRGASVGSSSCHNSSTAKKKRKSIKKFVTSSLSRKKKDRSISYSEDTVRVRNPSFLVRSASLDPEVIQKPVIQVSASPRTPQTEEMTRIVARKSASGSAACHQAPIYCNDSVVDKPPLPPERNHSLQPSISIPKREEGHHCHRTKHNSATLPTNASLPASWPSNKSASMPGRHQPQHSLQGPRDFNLNPQHILHKTCLKESLGDAFEPLDLVLIYSSACPVSSSWCDFFIQMIRSSANSCSQGQIIKLFQCQPVETFSELHSKEALVPFEERVFHAKAQLVLLSPDFLRWLKVNPNLIVGKVFRPTRLLGLLLGIDVSDFCEEHRASLLTFPGWKTMTAIANSQEFARTAFQKIVDLVVANTSVNPESPQVSSSLFPGFSIVNLAPTEKDRMQGQSDSCCNERSSPQCSILLLFARKLWHSVQDTRVFAICEDGTNDEVSSSMIELCDKEWVSPFALKIRLPESIFDFVDGNDGWGENKGEKVKKVVWVEFKVNHGQSAGKVVLDTSGLGRGRPRQNNAEQKSEKIDPLSKVQKLKKLLDEFQPTDLLELFTPVNDGGSFSRISNNKKRDLDQMLSNQAQNILPLHLFSRLQITPNDPESERGGRDLKEERSTHSQNNPSSSHFPSLLHWAAHHGLKQFFETLLKLPLARETATLLLNCQHLNALDLAAGSNMFDGESENPLAKKKKQMQHPSTSDPLFTNALTSPFLKALDIETAFFGGRNHLVFRSVLSDMKLQQPRGAVATKTTRTEFSSPCPRRDDLIVSSQETQDGNDISNGPNTAASNNKEHSEKDESIYLSPLQWEVSKTEGEKVCGGAGLYDVPRPEMDAYVVPPSPARVRPPVPHKKKNDSSYVPMLPQKTLIGRKSDVPTHPFVRRSSSASNLNTEEDCKKHPEPRRRCSCSWKPPNPRVKAHSLGWSNSDNSSSNEDNNNTVSASQSAGQSLGFTPLEFRPQSRQEILSNLHSSKSDEGEYLRLCAQSKKGDEQENVDDDPAISRELEDLSGFLPSPILSYSPSESSSSPALVEGATQHIDLGPCSSVFEQTQAELIDLQKKFKADLLSLNEVEERFKAWKMRPEIQNVKGCRQGELDLMREDWFRLQKMAAEDHSKKEPHVWNLLKGLTRSKRRKKTDSSGAGSTSFESGSSPEKSRNSLSISTATPRNSTSMSTDDDFESNSRSNSSGTSIKPNYANVSSSSYPSTTPIPAPSAKARQRDSFCGSSSNPLSPPQYDIPRKLSFNDSRETNEAAQEEQDSSVAFGGAKKKKRMIKPNDKPGGSGRKEGEDNNNFVHLKQLQKLPTPPRSCEMKRREFGERSSGEILNSYEHVI